MFQVWRHQPLRERMQNARRPEDDDARATTRGRNSLNQIGRGGAPPSAGFSQRSPVRPPVLADQNRFKDLVIEEMVDLDINEEVDTKKCITP
jgi:hypothetical protein